GEGGLDDASSKKSRDLNGGTDGAAACAKNERVFARLQLSSRNEHVPGGLENQRNRGSFFPFEVFGIGQAVDFRGAHKFGAAPVDHVAKVCGLAAVIVQTGEAGRAFAAAHERRGDNFLADANLGDVRAGFGTLVWDTAY